MTPSSTRKAPVRWTREEETSVAKKLAQLVVKFGLNRVPDAGAKTAEGCRYFNMIKMAQTAVLPEDRRRFMASRQNLPPRFDALVSRYVDELKNQPVNAPVPVVEAKPEVQPEQQRVVVNVQHGRTPLSDYKEDELAVEIVKRILAKSFKLDSMAEQIHKLSANLDEVSHRVSELAKYDELITDELGMLSRKMSEFWPGTSSQNTESEPVTAPTHAKAPRIAVVGLLKAQFEHIKSKIAAWPIQLEFVDQDKNPHRLSGVDFIVYARWISHKWTNCNSHLRRDQWAFASGGMNQVIELIEKAVSGLCKDADK